MRSAVTVAMLLSASVSAQSVSDTIIQRERAKLHAEHTGEGFDALYLRTYEGVNQGGQLQTRLPGSAFQTSAQPKFVLEEPLNVQVYQSAAIVTGVQAPVGARRVRFVRLWVPDGSDWKIAIHQGTTIAQAQPNATSVAPADRTATLLALGGEEATVLGIDKALSEAYAEHDARTYERWTAQDFVRVTRSGEVIPRDQWLKNNVVEDQNKRVPSANEDLKVRIFGDVAVVTSRDVTPRPDGTAAPERAIRILAKKNGAWQQVLMQSTLIQDATLTK